ncbi:inner membrane protein [Trabulsiella guamensis ATCC 49490]|uniref:Inner membrane protein n=1 Tax=Trabulsiella guamensis ATCC 49490 TaxID=1005994 RepID=A0A085ABB1_9ENTR|nr:YqjK-like family protein [Trabulsiella guamensis]KFC07506.1 inner membrane protein [Trabulsiella guamensis ATCC 49490]
MNHKLELQQRKARLLSRIQQQRLDLSASRRDWLDATHSYDRGWSALLNLRSWMLVGSSVAAIWTVRHPRFLVRWAKRGLGIWSAWRLIKATVREQQLRG